MPTFYYLDPVNMFLYDRRELHSLMSLVANKLNFEERD